MKRQIAWMTLAQFVLVVLAFVIVGVILKIHGYPSRDFLRWNPVAVAIREFGQWLLLFPAIWAAYAVACEKYERGFLSTSIATVIGTIFLVALLFLFLYALCVPYTRTILMDARPSLIEQRTQ